MGRVKAYEAIVKGENIAKPNIPESFKVLMKEIQSLALDMSVQSEAGDVLEVREEDDDLLRAAEELGIDLSAGLRRQQADAAELEQAGVPSSALQDVIGAGTEPEVEVEEIVEPDDSAAAATKDLLAAAAALSSEAEVFAGDGDQLPDLDDILEIDAADIESDGADTDEA